MTQVKFLLHRNFVSEPETLKEFATTFSLMFYLFIILSMSSNNFKFVPDAHLCKYYIFGPHANITFGSQEEEK